MYEIEIKAHVYNRDKVISILNSFAEYQCYIEKKDNYFRFPVSSEGEKPVTVRIRKEKIKKNNSESIENIFTYKKKEIRESKDGTSIEVNSENEFIFSDTAPLELLISDLNGNLYLKKEKYTEVWHLETEPGTANIELCTVPPLGDFLEIEIVSENNSPEFVSSVKKIEEGIIEKCGIPLSDIEFRYYSEMLRESLSDKK